MKANVVALLALAIVLASSACHQISRREERDAFRITGGDARQGPQTIRKYGCYTCHTIAGVPGARGLIGPSLNGIGERYFIAGQLPNTPQDMEHWIQHPHQFEPHTLMPEMNVTEQDSQNIAAYLYSLK